MEDSHNYVIENVSKEYNNEEKEKYTKQKLNKVKDAIFLASITGIFLISGFSTTLLTLRKHNPKVFNSLPVNMESNNNTGAKLAMRALGWATVYSTTACSAFVYCIWKFSGAKSFEEFRIKMEKSLPKISKIQEV